MKSLKKIINGIVFSVLGVLLISIFFNIFIVTDTSKEFNNDSLLISKLRTTYYDMNVPMRVLQNISYQTHNDTINDIKDENLKKAYIENKNLLHIDIVELNNISQTMITNLDAYSKHFMSPDLVYIDVIKEYINSINESAVNLNSLYKQTLLDTPNYKEVDPAEISAAYDALGPIIDTLSIQYNESAKSMLELYVLLTSILLFALLIVVLVLVAFITKFLGKDLKFILAGYDLLNKYDYSIEALPDLKATFIEEKKIKDSIINVIKEQRFIDEVKAKTSHGYIIDDVLDSLFFSIQKELRIDRVGIAFVDYNKRKIIAEHGISNYGDIILGPGFEIDFEDTTLTKLLNSKENVIRNDLLKEYGKRPHSTSLKLIIKEGIRSNMIIPLSANDTVFAFLFFSSTVTNNFDEHMLQIGKNIAKEIAELIDKTYLSKTMFATITRVFADLVDKKDNETGGHINRMVQYSTALAKELLFHPDPLYNVNNSFVNDIENNASIHDIGKVGIPDEILKKPGKLTPEEWAVMKTHSAIGGDIFETLKERLQIFNRNFYQVAENIARYHHERWDGTGYPEGLSNFNIPLEARVVAIADVLDALTSKRVYKAAYSFEESVHIIEESAGSHLDPVLVQLLIENLPKFQRIYEENRE